jgi:predicted GNAT superfamily acetyltransferase
VDARAWEAAHRAAEEAGVKLVELSDLDDADRARAVIDRVWGAQDMPRELLRAFQTAGSVLYGAEAGGDMVGFVLGFLGFGGGLHLHSHMLAAVPEWQSRGVGYALKLAQRAVCLDHGVGEVRWTFDPLLARNARFNLVKLGAVATRFLEAHYGEMGDRLNRGDRSDRFEVAWLLTSQRVESALAGRREDPVRGEPLLRMVAGANGDPEPRETGADPAPGAAVEIPADYFELRLRRPELAAAWRDAAGRAMRSCMGAGLEAIWFSRDCCYVFDRAELRP